MISSACSRSSRFTHRKVKSSPGDNVGRKVGRRSPFVFFEVWLKPFQRLAVSKGRAFGRPPQRAKLPSTAFSFCLAFSFVPAMGKRKSAEATSQTLFLFASGGQAGGACGGSKPPPYDHRAKEKAPMPFRRYCFCKKSSHRSFSRSVGTLLLRVFPIRISRFFAGIISVCETAGASPSYIPLFITKRQKKG